MNILIVEDENLQRENLVKIIEKSYIDIKVYQASNYNEAIKFIENKEINLFFLDINLNSHSGINLAEKIREIDHHKLTGIVFITAEFMHITEALKRSHCYDYIIKPYKDEEIIKIIDVFLSTSELNNSKTSKYILVEIDSDVSVKIHNDDIIFIKYENRCCEINTINGIYKSKRIALNKFIDTLNDKNVVQTHKAYAVNISYIERIEKSYDKLWNIILKQSEEFALLSYTYKTMLEERMK